MTRAATVSVGCKYPNGLILTLNEIRMHPNGKDVEAVLPREDVPEVMLNGANHPGSIADFGITQVAADFFAEWKKQNAKHPGVVKGFIFEAADEARATSTALERIGFLSGLEPLDPKAMPPKLTPDDRKVWN